MEKQERTKYAIISLKRRDLRKSFNRLGDDLDFRNADQTMEYMLGIVTKLRPETWARLLEEFECEGEYFETLDEFVKDMLYVNEGLRSGKCKVVEKAEIK
jgi:hypothetical protein